VQKEKLVRGVKIANEVFHDFLGHVQTLAILLAALIATDFFIFTPTVTSNVVQEYRVSASSVTDEYGAAGTQPPPVVLRTLADLSNRSIPIGQSATVVSSGASAPAGSQAAPAPAGASASASAAAASAVYPMAELCARSRATVESALGTGACTIGSQPEPPLYDRALLHYDEDGDPPLTTEQLHDAIARLQMALFARATITLKNAGQSSAQNVNIFVPDGYQKKSGTLPLSLNAGESTDIQFESQPGALASTKGAAVTNPTFTVRWDPTGPLSPQFTKWVIAAGVAALVVLAALDLVQAIWTGGDGSTETGPTA